MPPHPAFYVGAGDLRSGPHAYVPNTLATELSLQPPNLGPLPAGPPSRILSPSVRLSKAAGAFSTRSHQRFPQEC